MATKSWKETGAAGASPLTGDALHQRIAEMAYELYRRRGQREGDDLKDWYEAEQLVLTGQRAHTPTQASLAHTLPRSTGREARSETGRPA